MSASPFVVRFADESATTHSLVGGKGANLGLLTQAAFPVPPGFTVTTNAYEAFSAIGVGAEIARLASALDHDDAAALERDTAAIRDLIEQGSFPDDVASQIVSSYAALGDEPYVAVRSSGTAEDLAEASFAGMHDTYLDIRGAEDVLDAIKRCWASLWTARAASYRHTKGFDSSHGIAVVVQTMVGSEVSGVMFTANPLTAATDEIVINSSWGLGEAIVSGITTPDEFVLYAETLLVRSKILGSKEKRVVRDQSTGVGTVVEDVPEDERARFTLDESQLADLAELGRRVQAHYEGFPQDTEWGYADRQFYLLQSRPVTGVDISWDADVDAWQLPPEPPTDTVWTRAWSDDIWCGPISPLFYSIRARANHEGHRTSQLTYGNPDISSLRSWKFYRGNAYFNCEIEREFVPRTVWPAMRAGNLGFIPPAWHQEVLDRPFSIVSYVKMQARMAAIGRTSFAMTWIDQHRKTFFVKRAPELDGLPGDRLRRLSDSALKKHIDEMCELETQFIVPMWPGFFVHARDAFGALALMVGHWYDGERTTAFNDLITGVPESTKTIIENSALWRLAQRIRESESLTAVFEANENEAFFAAVGETDEGRAWKQDYDAFVTEHGHRGHADRDLYFRRRAEDSSIDYRSLRAFLASEGSKDPAVMEHETEVRRRQFIQEVAYNMRKKAFGGLRANLFLSTLNYVDQFLMFRDNERWFVDRITFSFKRGLLELNRRLAERGVFAEGNDFDYLMLTREELFEVFDGHGNMKLVRAKIEARARHFDMVHKRESTNPQYLVANKNADLEYGRRPDENDPDGLLRGAGTSGGTVEGVARVIKDLGEIGRVASGEILITNSTDPGWTPVFSVIAAIVLETGGLLAHGSCLAREYGMPAVHLPSAIRLIPDGSRIRINGDAGTIELLDEAAPVSAELAEPVSV